MSVRSFAVLTFVCSTIVWSACSTTDMGLIEKLDANQEPEPDAALVPDVPVRKLDAAPDTAATDASASDAGDARVEAGQSDGPADATSPADGPRDTQADNRPTTNLANGTACLRPMECKSGFCVNGVCCNEACTNGCQACVRTRTDKADGMCGAAKDLDKRPCGNGCVQIPGDVTAVLQKQCTNGACVIPPAATEIERCTDPNPCVSVFCDDNAGRCVRLTCPMDGTCCCRGPGDARSCVRRNTCTGDRMCLP
jgi:hypothetical protein